MNKESIELAVAPGVTEPFRSGSFEVSDFDYRSPDIVPPLPTRIPEAARVITALELGARLGGSRT